MTAAEPGQDVDAYAAKIIAKITSVIAVTEDGARPLGVAITRRSLDRQAVV